MKQKADQNYWDRLWGGFPKFFNEGHNLRLKKREVSRRVMMGHIPSLPDIKIGKDHAADAIIKTIENHSNVEIVAIGPLTNIATAFKQNPDIIKRISRVTIMGGYLGELDGFPKSNCGAKEMTNKKDFNMQSDSEASKFVVNSGASIRLITPDVTLRTWLTKPDIYQLSNFNSPLIGVLIKQNKLWSKIQKFLLGTDRNTNLGYLHDPLTIASIANHGLCSYSRIRLRAVTENGAFRLVTSPDGQEIECARTVDSMKFKSFFLQRLIRHEIDQIFAISGIQQSNNILKV